GRSRQPFVRGSGAPGQRLVASGGMGAAGARLCRLLAGVRVGGVELGRGCRGARPLGPGVRRPAAPRAGRGGRAMKISVLLATYDAAWCVERALDSVFAQTRPADE